MNYNHQVPLINIETEFNNLNLANNQSILSKSPNNYSTITISPNLTNTTFTNSTTASPVSFLSINSNSNIINNFHNINNRPMSLDFTPLNAPSNESPPQQQPQLGIKNRHRAGTLPSRFQSSNASNLLSTPSNSNTLSSFSPSLNLFSDDLFSASTLSATSNDLSNGNRLRSNSFQTSLWSNTHDQVSPSVHPVSNPNSNTVTPNFTLSNPSMLLMTETVLPPPLLPTTATQQQLQLQLQQQQQQQQQRANRVRSFSTNNAIQNHPDLKNYYLQQFSTNGIISEENELDQLLLHLHLQNQQQQAPVPPVLPSYQYENSKMQEIFFAERPRAQTYTNGLVKPMIDPNQLQQQAQQEANRHTQQQFPILLDDVPHTSINFISTFQDSTLPPSDTVILVNLPNNGLVTLSNFHKLLSKFGIVKVVRIIVCSNGDLICMATFDNLESAVNCKVNLNNQELIPGLSCIVAFAKIVNNKTDLKALAPQKATQLPKTSTNDTNKITQNSNSSTASLFPEFSLVENLENYKKAVSQFENDLNAEEFKYLNHIIDNATKYKTEQGFGLLPETSVVREFDSPRLREIRKDIESNKLSQLEVEQLALAMISEIPELASDYLGNTIVQKLFDICSALIRDIMLLKLSPYLSQMGIHKNGTWAAQKLMTTATTVREKNIISHSLKPYCSNLFNDQFGNYVLQCVLKFGSPWNDFITELILHDFLDISKSRFGARAIRACLESDALTKEQVIAIASIIMINCNSLATNPNGSLLITWYLDTCQLTDRHLKLLPLFTPNLLALSTHKLGSLSILKILNYRNDVRSRNYLLSEIFGESIFEDDTPTNDILPTKTTKLLHDILSDNINGVTFIHKTLSIPLLEPNLKQHMIQLIRIALIDLNVLSSQGYKRLAEDVGLKPIGNGSSNNESSDQQHGKRNNYRRGPVNGGGNNNDPRVNPLSGYFQPPPQQMQRQQLYPQQQQQQQFYSMDQFYQQQKHLMQPQPQYIPEYFQQQQATNAYQFPHQKQQQQSAQNDVLNQLEQLSLASLARGYSDSPIS